MEVTNRRPLSNEQRLEELQARVNSYKEAIRKADQIEDNISSPIWQEIKNRMVDDVRKIDDMLYDFDSVSFTDRKIFSLLGQRKQAVGVLGIEDFAASKEKFQDALKKTQQEIDAIKIGSSRSRTK